MKEKIEPKGDCVGERNPDKVINGTIPPMMVEIILTTIINALPAINTSRCYRSHSYKTIPEDVRNWLSSSLTFSDD